MATEKPPSIKLLGRYDRTLNEAVHAVAAEFEWMGLPDEGSDQRTELLYRLNDAIGAIMREWL